MTDLPATQWKPWSNRKVVSDDQLLVRIRDLWYVRKVDLTSASTLNRLPLYLLELGFARGKEIRVEYLAPGARDAMYTKLVAAMQPPEFVTGGGDAQAFGTGKDFEPVP